MHGRPDLLWFLDAWMRFFVKWQSAGAKNVQLPQPVPRIWPQEHPAQTERKGKLLGVLRKALGGK